ncbi:MAG: LysR family transcriptional regulator [Cyclobacteriaceae bacterium]|nr:LysR family transcriptional regulator [Cyclobacteriaceae bacterium]
MNYTLHQLQIFLKIKETGSITKAAEALHLTQPAVSIQLKNFQDQFDIALTEVVGRKLFITDFGKEIALAAERIMDEVQKIDYRSSSFKGKLYGRLKISVVSTGKYVIPYFLSGFVSQHESIELLLDVTNKQRVTENLEKNEIDFGLVSVLPERIKIEKIELMSNKLYLVSNADVRKSQKANDRKLLSSLPLIFRESGSSTLQIMEKFMLKHHLPLKKKMELTSNEAVKQAVMAGLGSSIMPLIGIRNELNNGSLQIIPIKGLPIQSTWNLIWLKGKKLSPVASAFLDYIKRNKSAIIKEKFDWYEKY